MLLGRLAQSIHAQFWLDSVRKKGKGLVIVFSVAHGSITAIFDLVQSILDHQVKRIVTA